MKSLVQIIGGFFAFLIVVIVLGVTHKGNPEAEAKRAQVDARYQEEVCPMLKNLMQVAKQNGMVSKEDVSSSTLHVDRGFYLSKLEEKKVLLETWAKCRGNGTATAIDAYSGKKVAKYSPLWGYTVAD